MGDESQSCKRAAASDDHRSILLLNLMKDPVCVGNNMLVCGVALCPTALNPSRGSCTLHIVHDLKASRRGYAEGKKVSAFDTLYRTQAAWDQQKDHTRDDDGSFWSWPAPCLCGRDCQCYVGRTSPYWIQKEKRHTFATRQRHEDSMPVRQCYSQDGEGSL